MGVRVWLWDGEGDGYIDERLFAPFVGRETRRIDSLHYEIERI